MPTQDARPVHALMSGLIDYAGLFPPARWPMDRAVRAYGEYLAGPDSWMLGRFIVPVSRLEDFRKAAADVLPTGDDAGEPWPMSALIDGDLDENLDAVFAFNHEHQQPERGLAVIDAIEVRVPMEPAPTGSESGDGLHGAAFIDDAIERIPPELFPFFEIAAMPSGPGLTPPDFRGCIAALAGADAGAKLRTGGVTPDAFPSTRTVAEFLIACRAADVPFKATAGLHHAVRGEHPLTYEPGCPRSVMHGFLNLFVAAVMIDAHRLSVDDAAAVLERSGQDAFRFDERTLRAGDLSVGVDQIDRARDMFALSYGSCSFVEPVAELRAMGAL
jgi:hypothetical protein